MGEVESLLKEIKLKGSNMKFYNENEIDSHAPQYVNEKLSRQVQSMFIQSN